MDLDDVSACAFCSLAPDQPTHCFNHSSASDACPGRGPRARNRARPHRPDRVDVARVLARVPRWEHHLGGVTVTDRPVRCPHGQVEDRPLVALSIFAVIGTVRRITVTGRGWKFAQLGSQPRKTYLPDLQSKLNFYLCDNVPTGVAVRSVRRSSFARSPLSTGDTDSPQEQAGFEPSVPLTSATAQTSMRRLLAAALVTKGRCSRSLDWSGTRAFTTVSPVVHVAGRSAGHAWPAPPSTSFLENGAVPQDPLVFAAAVAGGW